MCVIWHSSFCHFHQYSWECCDMLRHLQLDPMCRRLLNVLRTISTTNAEKDVIAKYFHTHLKIWLIDTDMRYDWFPILKMENGWSAWEVDHRRRFESALALRRVRTKWRADLPWQILLVFFTISAISKRLSRERNSITNFNWLISKK
jgi:hypothetical protein